MLVNIKAGSRKINRKLRSIVTKIALWNDPQVDILQKKLPIW